MRKLLISGGIGLSFVFLLFVVIGFICPALDGALLQPGFILSKALNLANDGLSATVGIAVSWLLWGTMVVGGIELIRKAVSRQPSLVVISALCIAAFLVYGARGSSNQQFEGTWERGFESSNFYSRSDCWRLPYWLKPTQELETALSPSANRGAIKIKFIGEASSIGAHGHLGKYLREIRVTRVIQVEPATPCNSRPF